MNILTDLYLFLQGHLDVSQTCVLACLIIIIAIGFKSIREMWKESLKKRKRFISRMKSSGYSDRQIEWWLEHKYCGCDF